MSVYVDVYTDAWVDGKWVNIDLYTYYPSSDPKRPNFHLVPAVSGQSAVMSALRDISNQTPLHHDDLSAKLQSCIRNSEDLALRAVPGYWFAQKNLDKPEYSGYIPRQSILNYEAGISNDPDPGCDILTASEYRSLNPDEQQGYQYYEWTESWGTRDIWRRIKDGIQLRLNAFEDYCRQWDGTAKKFLPDQIGWEDVRVVFHIS